MLAAERISRSIFRLIGLPQGSFFVVAADASWPVEKGVRSVGVRRSVDFHPRLDEMRPRRAFRDLELQRSVGHAIVMADLPLLLDAQDLVEVDAGNGREGQLRGRGNSKRALWRVDKPRE